MASNPWLPQAPTETPDNPWLSAVTATAPGNEAPSLGGFVGNILGGLEGLVTGVGQLGGSVLHDVAKAATEAVTLGKADWGGGYQGYHIAAALPGAVAKDFSERYGSLLPGGRPASEFLQELYDKPVSFGLDALALGSAATKVGSVAGNTAVKAAGAEDMLAQAVETLESAGVATKTAKAAGLRSTLDALGKDTLLKRALPAETYMREGDALRLGAESYNPLTRFVKAQTFGRATTQSITDLEHSIAATLAEARTPAQFNKVAEMEQLLADARLKGLDTVETQRMGTYRASAAGRAINKFTSGEFYKDRLRAVREDKTGWLNAAKASLPEEVNGLSAHILNTDIKFTDLAPDGTVIARMETQLGAPLIEATLAGEAVAMKTAVAPEVLQKLEGTPALDAAQKVLDEAAKLRQNLLDNEAVIHQLNPTYDIAAHIEGVDHMVHDVVHGLDVTADPTTRPGLLEKEAQRLRDITRKMPGWETYEPSSMPLQLVSEAYRSAQYMHGAEVVIGSEPGVLNTITGPGYQDFANAYRRLGKESPAYYPFIESNTVKTSDWFMPRRLRGAVKFAKDPHENFNAGKLLRADNYIKDPAEAYARRAARGVRMGGTARMIAAYAEKGRPITEASQLADGEVIIAPGIVHLSHQISNKFRDVTEELMTKGASEQEAKVAALHQVGKETIDNITAQLATDGGIKMYAVPEVMAKHMNDAAKWAGLVPSGAHIYVDGPMNVWRSLVLAGSPRWIVNNVLGNSVFSVMQGAPVSRAFHLLEQQYKQVLNDKFGTNFKTGLLDAVDEELKKAGLYDSVASGGYNEVEAQTTRSLTPNQADTTAGRIVEKTREAPGRILNRFQKIGGGVRSLNSQIEGAFRRNSWLTEVEKAKSMGAVKRSLSRFRQSGASVERLLKDGLTPGETRATLNGVNHFLGDFTNLGPVERNIVRPYLVPFWGFYKFQAKLFLSFPFEYPLRTQVLEGLANVTKDLSDAYGPRPDWLQGAVPLGPPGGGEMGFLTTSGPNPFSGLFSNPLGQLSPLIKIPTEMALGRSLFTGKKFSDRDTVTPFGSDQQFHIVRDAQGRPIDVVPISKVSPGLLESALGQIPQYQLIKDLIAGGSTYDTATILDALKGKAALLNEDGTPKYPNSLAQIVSKFAGFPVTNYDLSKYQEFLALQQQSARDMAQGQV